MYAPLHHRRAALIQERLPHVSAKPIVFPAAAPTAPLGSWTLLAPDRMLAAAQCSSPFPNGEVTLVEDKDRPAQPRLPQAMGGAGAATAMAAAGRALPRSRRLARRLDLGPGQARRRPWSPSTRRRSIPRSRRCRASTWRGESAFALDAGQHRGRRLAVLRHRLLSGAAAAAGRDAGVRRAWCRTSSAPSSSRVRPITMRRPPSRPSRAHEVVHLHHNKHELTLFIC